MNAHDKTDCPTCEGDGYLGDPELDARKCRRCNGRGTLQLWELDDEEMPELEEEEA